MHVWYTDARISIHMQYICLQVWLSTPGNPGWRLPSLAIVGSATLLIRAFIMPPCGGVARKLPGPLFTAAAPAAATRSIANPSVIVFLCLWVTITCARCSYSGWHPALCNSCIVTVLHQRHSCYCSVIRLCLPHSYRYVHARNLVAFKTDIHGSAWLLHPLVHGVVAAVYFSL